MAVLEFKGYHVNKMAYTKNEKFEISNEKIKLSPTLSTNFDIKKNEINVSLKVGVGSIQKKNIPFFVECSLTGVFIYKKEEDKTEVGLDTLIRNNAVAILYPYVRAIISTLTMTSNEFPNYNLPTINVGQALKEQNNK